MDLMRVTYRLRVDSAAAEARAEELAREQTVEVPREAVRDPFVVSQVLGRVERVSPESESTSRAVVAYPVETTALDPAQLLNVLFGNSSLQGDVECLDVELPASVLVALHGPRFGLPGLRKTLGVYDRPLTCTAAKPMGLSPEALADLCRTFASAGIDVIKDDHGLADHSFCPFEERVRACLAAVDRVADETGHRAVYVPNLMGAPQAVFRQLRIAEEYGARAVMASPMLLGMPLFWELCQQHSSLPVLAHPAFAGRGIAPPALLGKLFRLYGADAVIYVSYGSRFSSSREDCRATADRLLRPWGQVLPSLPVPGGGIAVENAAEVARFYGRDAMLLVGGSLQVEPDALGARSRAFVAAVRGAVD